MPIPEIPQIRGVLELETEKNQDGPSLDDMMKYLEIKRDKHGLDLSLPPQQVAKDLRFMTARWLENSGINQAAE